MDWDKLKTFHFAAETGSLTAAAEKLGVSQSSVSRQIAALENDMGVPLFQRHARGLLLTGPGMALREFTREMAGAAVIAESTLKDAREKVIGDLERHSAGGVRLDLARAAAGRFRRHLSRDAAANHARRPRVRSAEARSRVRDPALGGDARDLIQRKLLEVHVSLYASAGYLQRHGTPKKVEDLDHHRIIAYQTGVPTPMRELDWAQRAGREDAKPRPPLLEINNVYGMLRAVESGFGIASVPDYMARENPNLVKVLPELPGPELRGLFHLSQRPEALQTHRRLPPIPDRSVRQLGAVTGVSLRYQVSAIS